MVEQPAPSSAQLLRGALRRIRSLRLAEGLRPLRVAVLQGSTAHEVTTLLELFLLERGFLPVFWNSEYGKYYEDAVLDPSAITAFEPDIVYVHTHVRNVQSWPFIDIDGYGLESAVNYELKRYTSIWESLKRETASLIIQNNFEYPDLRALGSLDSIMLGGATRFIAQLNLAMAEAVRLMGNVAINDINYLSAQMGLNHWYQWSRWFSYKLPCSLDGSVAIANSLAALIGARFGMAKKCLVLDLDNTLWGGVIGDDGVERIVLGRETAEAEAYTHFQEYCLSLKKRGVILAVCSKNTEKIAESGFAHPDSILKLADFSCFRANWERKDENIKAIASSLNIGLDSLVFIDDNPAERALVAAQLPAVAVPEVGSDVSEYPRIIDRLCYFEAISITADDLSRADTYKSRASAEEASSEFKNYDEYLAFLTMVAEVGPFVSVYLDRITQLTNKSNQFNLTTRRYSSSELEKIASDLACDTIYVRLSDRFGDHGLISVVIVREEDEALNVDLWLMSCRVLKRGVELLVLDEIVQRARARDIHEIRGSYIPTPKNAMVADHYSKLGFDFLKEKAGVTIWSLNIKDYENRNRNIHVNHSGPSTPGTAADISRRVG